MQPARDGTSRRKRRSSSGGGAALRWSGARLTDSPAARIAAAVWIWLTVAWVTLVMHTNVPLFVDFHGDAILAPRFDFALMGLALPVLLLTWRRWWAFAAHPYFHWFVLLVAIYALAFYRLNAGGDATGGATAEDVGNAADRLQRAVLVAVYGYLAFALGRHRFEPMLVAAAVVVPAMAILDFVRPDLTKPLAMLGAEGGRSTGMYLNANVAAEAILITLLLVHRAVRGNVLVALYLLAGLGVLATFSRGGLVAWVAVGAMLLVSRRVPRWAYALPVLIAVFYSSLVVYAEEVLPRFVESEFQVAQMVERLRFFETVAADDVDDFSAEERRDVALASLEGAIERPLGGYAISTEVAFGVGSHNQPLDFWYAFGAPGLAAWLWMLWLLNRYAPSRLLGVVSPEALLFLWFSMFSHTLFNYNFWFVFYALTVAGSDGPVALRWVGLDAPLRRLRAWRRSAASKGARRGRRQGARRGTALTRRWRGSRG